MRFHQTNKLKSCDLIKLECWIYLTKLSPAKQMKFKVMFPDKDVPKNAD